VTAELPALGFTALAPQRVGQALPLGQKFPAGHAAQAAMLACPGTLLKKPSLQSTQAAALAAVVAASTCTRGSGENSTKRKKKITSVLLPLAGYRCAAALACA
jgi:hypothetical protein